MFYPCIQEISYQDPSHLFSHFFHKSGSLLLESVERRENTGRYSFIAIDPFAILKSKANKIEWNGEKFEGNPFYFLKEMLSRYRLSTIEDLPPFQGGAAGFFSYGLLHHLEKITVQQEDRMQFDDMAIGFYDIVIGFDHLLKRAWIFSSGFPEETPRKRERRAQERLESICEKIKNLPVSNKFNSTFRIDEKEIISNFTREEYMTKVREVVDYILKGDIFEANISLCFSSTLPTDVNAYDLYQRLRFLNPAPFSAFLHFNETQLVSASPERFLKVKNKTVETRPIKGTRKRGKTPLEDRMLETELLQSEKDHAENIMIVDLLRNDLSRVCEEGSVNVPQLCGLESFATVHHLVSIVTGKLREEASPIDLMMAAFPGGSITGAPKIRAMEIIAEIEPTTRGPYCGSIGYLGFNGDMDSSIVIRTFAIKNQDVTFQAGGAIVLDSDPESEYEEVLTKAYALKRALMGEGDFAVIDCKSLRGALATKQSSNTLLDCFVANAPRNDMKAVRGSNLVLLIDNYDSFVYNLARYVGELDFPYLVKRNDAISLEEIAQLKPHKIIISPGPGIPSEAGISSDIIRYFGATIPILGVCLGHQAIGEIFGGVVKSAKFPMHGKASDIIHEGKGLFQSLKTPFRAARYHSLIVDDENFPACLKVTARSDTNEIMALEHRKFPIFGVQFHPESVLTSGGYQLLQNFLSY